MKRFGCASFVLLAFFSGLSGFAAPAQQQPPATFKSEVGVIEINAVVTDAAGNVVRDLAKDDFQVYEDGRLRPFAFFSLVDMPVLSPARAAARGPEPDVRSVAENRNGRVYVLVLDDLHTAPLRTALLNAAARRFIEQYFYPGDLAAIVRTGPGQAAGQELTTSRRLLLAAIDRFQGQQIDPASEGRLETARRQGSLDDRPNDRLDDPNDAERSFNARRTLNALRDTATWMAGINGRRKSVIFFSEGIDYDINDVFNSRGASGVLMDARDSIGAATRSNVSIYSIDPRGLAGLSDEFIGLIEPQTGTRVGREQLGTQGIERDLRVAQDSLRMLAEETGGLALVNSNDFAGGFERIVRDNSSYYVLGYYTQPDKGGKFHKVDVRVRRPGLQVRARRGYVTSDSKTSGRESPRNSSASAVLRDALNSPMPAGNLPMTVFAAPFKGDAKHASVVIAAEIAGGSLKFQQRDALFFDDLEFSLLAVGQNGKIEETDRGNVSLSVKPDTQQRIIRNGVRFLSRIALPPGRYQMRVAAREAGGGAASVVHYDLEVPDFNSEPLSVSGLVLTTTSAGETATTRADAPLQARLPTPPTVARTFAPGEVLTVYAEIYDNVTHSPHRLDMVTTIKPANSDGNVFSHSSETPASTQSIPYLVEVPLKGLAPGAYVLRVGVRSRLGNGPGVSREVPFTIQGVTP